MGFNSGFKGLSIMQPVGFRRLTF